MNDDIETIKNSIRIYDLANMYHAEPQKEDGSGAVRCKHNPLREEKTSSLFIHPSTNSWIDHGSDRGGSIIDFLMEADDLTPGDAIRTIKRMAGLDNDIEVVAKDIKPYKPKEIDNTSIFTSDALDSIFSKMSVLNTKKEHHKKELLEIAPEYLYKSAHKDDLAFLKTILKYDEGKKTSILIVKDGNKTTSLRHRRISKLGEVRKWFAWHDSKSNFPYIRDKKDEVLLIVEGSHDYITAMLAGYSVIGLPSAGYKLDPIFVTGRKCLFIADNDTAGHDGMKKTITHCAGEGVVFDHDKFCKDNNITNTPKDFSDYVMEFDNLKALQIAIALHIETMKETTAGSYIDILKELNEHVTDEMIENLKNVDVMIDGILPRSQITTLVGKPNVGKSAISLSFINKLLYEKKIESVIYLDGDNPLQYASERLKKLKSNHLENQIFYYSGSSTNRNRMTEILSILSTRKGGGENVLIIVDSLKNFINGSINEDKLINPFYDLLQAIRDRFGATILVLHHTKKGKDEDGKSVYVGSQVIEASSDNMILASRKDDDIILKPTKMRAILEDRAYTMNFEEMTINSIDVPNEDEDTDTKQDTDEENAEKIALFLEDYKDGISPTELSKKMTGIVSKKKVSTLLFDKRFLNNLWRSEQKAPTGWRVFPKYSTQPKEIIYEMPSMELF